jgi:hypothetical protein
MRVAWRTDQEATMRMMRIVIRTAALALGMAGLFAPASTGQTQETRTTTRTKIELKGGKDVTATGCLERTPGGDYVLTGPGEDRGLERRQYVVVSDEDLSKYVNRRVEIKGKAVDKGAGKVEIEAHEKTEADNGQDREEKTKTVATGGELGIPFLGVKSLKSLSSSCN